MKRKNSIVDFNGQAFYIGLDVHSKSWKVTVRSKNIELETFSMPPSVQGLASHMARKYKGGKYYSVYEAGFCGYHYHKELISKGIINIIINPSDVPTTGKEKDRKTDKIDSRKLARELENGSIEGIYIPTELQLELRSLSRLRYTLVKEQTRIKNRIKSYLYFNGKDSIAAERYWSSNYIYALKQIEFDYEMGKQYLQMNIESLENCRAQLAEVLRKLRKLACKYGYSDLIERFTKTVPGIGFVTAINLISEIMDINRFSSTAKLASFIGLVPSIKSSGDTNYKSGLTKRKSKYLRYLLVEVAWIAIKKDEALFLYYSELSKRMNKKRAIISVARKLLSRIRYVWLSEEDYAIGLVK